VKTTSSNTLSATISNLFPKLSSAQAAGHARVIQSGVVVTEVGKMAKISKNTKKQFQFGGGEYAKTGEANSGFDLTIGDADANNPSPRLLNDDTVETSILLSVKMVIGTSDIPDNVSNDISTRIFIKSRESAVIGGLVVNSSMTDYDRNPPGGVQTAQGGSELFSFIRSKKFQETKSQFVVFITPELIESASTGIDEIKQKFRSRRR